MNLRRYKDTLVGKGSALELALSKPSSPDTKREVEKIYEETSKTYKKLYPEEDRKWFHEKSFPPKPTITVVESLTLPENEDV